MKRLTKAIAAIGTGALLGLLMVRHGVASGGEEGPQVVKSSPLPASVPSKRRLAHVTLTEATSVAAKKGWLQDEFAKVNADVDLVLVTQYGGTGVEASLLDRGDLHITSRMAYPAAQHRANGLDAVVIWQSVDPEPHRAVTIVLADSKVKSIADLTDKKVGSSIIGCPYYAMRESIIAAGSDVDTQDQRGNIRFINITSAAANSAFLAGQFDGYGTHPATSTVAPLYVRNDVREIALAVPNGAYTTAGGRTMFFAMRKWAQENPDLVKAFLLAYARTVKWLTADNGAHIDEASSIASREMREPKAVAKFDFTYPGTIAFDWGQVDYQNAVDSVKKFQKWAIDHKDPFYVRHHLSDEQIATFIDKRFFKGGEYFVDTSRAAK